MTKVRTNLGVFLALFCVLGLLLGPTAARADEGKNESGTSHSEDKDGKDDKDGQNEDREDRDEKDDDGDEQSAQSGESDERDEKDNDGDNDDRDGSTTSSTSSSTSSSSGTATQGGNLRCPAGTVTLTINNNPGNGTFSDGTLTFTTFNADSDSFNWTSNRTVDRVMIKGGPETTVNPGGTSGFAVSAFNPSSGQNYGISHVTICYTTGGGTPPPPPPPEMCPTNPNLPLNHPDCGTPPPPVCPTNPNLPLGHPNCDEVEGRTDTVNPLKVCPSGPFAGMPFTNPRDCLVAQVLPNVIRRQAGPGVEAAAEPAGAALPFTGTGNALSLIGAALVLMNSGAVALTMVARRKR